VVVLVPSLTPTRVKPVGIVKEAICAALRRVTAAAESAALTRTQRPLVPVDEPVPASCCVIVTVAAAEVVAVTVMYLTVSEPLSAPVAVTFEPPSRK